jgi:Phosphotransferase enzyme family
MTHAMTDDARPVTDFIDAATTRNAVQPPDGKSTSSFERLVVDGERYFLKQLSPATDWIMRVTGDHVHRPYLVWRSGLMDAVPRQVDPAVIAMEVNGEGDDAVLSILMPDVADLLVPEGDSQIPMAQHRGFLEHLAALSGHFWGWTDSIGGLTTMQERLRFFSRENVDAEMSRPAPPGPIVAAHAGWQALAERSPTLARVAGALHREPEILTEPLAATPVTFLHGDWKMGNLGTRPDGRTILLDWAYPGSGPACWDLAWYLALNRSRLPESKDSAITAFVSSLRELGLDPDGWFETQLDLCLVAMMSTFGWEKALGDDAELRWWEQAVTRSLVRQGIRL